MNEPPPYLLSSRPVLGQDRIQVREEILHYLQKKDTRPIFLIGAWGSGKTTFVQSIRDELALNYRYTYRSFFAVSTLNEAYLNMLPRLVWLGLTSLCFALSLCAAIFVIRLPGFATYKDAILAAFTLLFFLLVSNRMRLFYVAASISNLALWGKSALTVIDDLERSSLSSADIWTLLSNLWTVDQQYLILLGYDSESERTDVIERAAKLEGHVINLPTDNGVNIKIAKSLDEQFSFSASDCYRLFTPRDVVRIYAAVAKEAGQNENPLYRDCLYANFYFRALLEKLGVTRNDYANLQFFGSNYGEKFQFSIGPKSYRQEIGALQHFAADLGSFNQSLNPRVSDILARQLPPTMQLFMTTDNIFELRRLFGTFVGVKN